MDCSDAKNLIHLVVGDDLRADEEQQLTNHLQKCKECCDYRSSMANAMVALFTLRGNSDADPATVRSVWPAVSSEIQKRRTTPAKAAKFNLQVVALSVCSLSLAVVTIVQSLASMRNTAESGGLMPAQSVSTQMSTPAPLRYSDGRHVEPTGSGLPFFPQPQGIPHQPQSF